MTLPPTGCDGESGGGWLLDLSPELWLVVESARRSVGAPARALRPVADWDAVLRHASEQHLFPAVNALLRQEPLDAPPAVRQRVETGATMARLERTHRQEPAIRLALSTLVAAGCTPVLLKGVALGYGGAYSNPAYRQFSDVDVLLPNCQLERAQQALLGARFKIVGDPRVVPDHHHWPPLAAAGDAILVELHHALFDAACPFTFDPHGLLARARPATILGVAVRTLAPEDALIHVCTHLAYGHRYTRYPLRSLVDVLALVRSGALDWGAVVARTRCARADGAVYWPLVLARLWLGAPVPEAVLRALAPGRTLRRLVGAVMRTGYVLDRARAPDDGTRVLFDLLLKLSLFSGCSGRYQLAEVVRGLFPPRDAVSHLSPRTRASRLEYALALARLSRVWRGTAALWRILAVPRSDRTSAARWAGRR